MRHSRKLFVAGFLGAALALGCGQAPDTQPPPAPPTAPGAPNLNNKKPRNQPGRPVQPQI